MTLILAIDTATPFLTLGLLETTGGTETLALETIERVERAHGERIAPAVSALFERAGRRPFADVVAVGTGPGSYTGVRVGASLALGLARAWDARVVPVGTLESVAARAAGIVAASLDARKGNLYGAVYRVKDGRILEALAPVEKRPAAELEALVPAGATWLRDEHPGGLALARLALGRPAVDAARLELSYL